MDPLIDGAINRARMVLTVLVCALIAGVVVYSKLPKEAQPDIQVPFVTVVIPLEGISPEDAERLLIRPTETELQSIEGLKRMDAAALDGAAQIFLEFEITADIEQALVDVREKVDMAKREYPDDTREPVIQEANTSLTPVAIVNLYGDMPERGLYRLARELQDTIEVIPGVLEANINGEREEVLEIIVDPVKLETYNISYQEISNTIQANNRLIPAGRIDMGEGRYSVKIPGLIETAEDAFNLPLRRNGDAIVRLQDVAEIRRTFKDREVYARFNGRPAVAVEIIKRSGANILDTVDAVRVELEKLQSTWPETVEVEITSDQSKTIGDQLGTLESSIITAVVLVMIIVVAALGLRSAMLVGISIPASFLMGFLWLGLAGYTVNMMVLFGLLIAVGILVDGAIVIVEYADRKMAEGLDKAEAFGLAGKRMFWPIVASNATTLAAFLPFLFWNSIAGKFMSYLPITLIFVLVSSLLMALIFLPVLGSVVGGRAKSSAENDEALRDLSGADGDPLRAPGFIGFYARLIAGLIQCPIKVTLTVIAVMIGVFFWFGSTQHKSVFFLDAEPEQLFVYVGAQGNISADEEYEIVRRAEDLILSVEGVTAISTTSGKGAGSQSFGDGTGSIPIDTIGRILVDVDSNAPGVDGKLVEQDIRDRLSSFVGGHIEVAELEQGPPTGKDVQIVVTSNDEAALLDVTNQVRAKLDSMDGLVDIEDTRPLPGTEWRLEVDRERAAQYGASVAEVGGLVQLVTNGILVGRYRPDDARDEVDIRVRLPAEVRSLETLDSLKLATPSGPTPISTFVERVPAPRLDKIDRRNGKRIYTLRANAAEAGTGDIKVAEISKWLAQQSFPETVDVGFEGSAEDQQDAGAFFQAAAFGVLFMMGVILLWEFNNFYHVALTLSSVILSTVGVLIGLQIGLDYISFIMTGTGVVALAGIVVNNNIVLIDTFQRLYAESGNAQDAAIRTASQRLRPILLTTGTTICGLLPMTVQLNINFGAGTIAQGGPASEWWVPLSTVIVYGLGFSTFVTLVVTPVWLAAPEKMGRWRKRMVNRFFPGTQSPSLEKELFGEDGAGEEKVRRPEPIAANG